MTNKAKKKIRDIQDETGWKYQFCAHLVTNLGYDFVRDRLANRGSQSLEDCGKELNQLAKA